MTIFTELFKDWAEYVTDSAQRSVLFWDVLRKRGNIAVEHFEQGKPPLLAFEHEMVLDGRTLDRPANYALLRILPRPGQRIDPAKRPFIVVDPRAGHGPGIGGFKEDSEVGFALRFGHPCYFVTFFPEPEPGQTLEDVARAEALFVQKVRELHPDSDKPCIYGNCQAGWAVAILSAARPEIMGPIILAGAPLSYWAGVEGANPMRYTGGLTGGSWAALLASDLGNGRFDGANLVRNFENLNPANTYWSKYYNLYSRIDTEEERFLEFERWWGGIFLMNEEEILAIVNGLFIGNKLARGEIVSSQGGKTIDLRNIRSPIVIFASWGDNITPPQQALNWIADVYDSAEEIRTNEQVIVYTLHEDVGHLGIFVSARVAQKHTSEFIGGLDFIDILPPGLYELIIDDKRPDLPNADLIPDRYVMRFEPREIADILKLDDTREDELRFEAVARVSQVNEGLYETFARPWITPFVTEASARWLRLMHPARLERLTVSDHNPFMRPLEPLAEAVRRERRPAAPGNPFVQAERRMSDGIVQALEEYRKSRDLAYERLFKAIYGAPLVEAAVGLRAEGARHVRRRGDSALRAELAKARLALLATRIEEGGRLEALMRALIYVFREDRRMVDERTFRMMERIRDERPDAERVSVARVKDCVRIQAAILQIDEERAIRALPSLVPDRAGRERVLDAVRRISLAQGALSATAQARLDQIQAALGLEERNPGRAVIA
ncbi:DUF3141 domain-containing protein [Skermanella mucosa]|uniref:DUF3141 domain-containing protein n=1 Tax=Skermanella mucosa TaxID=1789672 RepID=UPI00192AC297|nr:DUF3141 domain-containing protein [Skermanella mucosa]UEM23227.1 DUF3141 domain-containing protein [Skermanella mucosa]